MKRITGQKKTECPRCEGIGYTIRECTEMRMVNDQIRTTKQGSACEKCHGIGQVAKP